MLKSSTVSIVLVCMRFMGVWRPLLPKTLVATALFVHASRSSCQDIPCAVFTQAAAPGQQEANQPTDSHVYVCRCHLR